MSTPATATTALFLLLASQAYAQTGANVLLVINSSSADSVTVGRHYAEKRGLHQTNVLSLQVPPGDTIGRRDYDRLIERPIGQWLARHAAQDRILYIVLAKDIPLRVEGTSGRNGTLASVDSELTLLYRRLTGAPVAPHGPVENPYFAADRPPARMAPFTHRFHDIYLVSRLDGFTVADALGLVDRAQQPTTRGGILFDAQASASPRPSAWLFAAAERLRKLGHGDRILIEGPKVSIGSGDGVLGYSSSRSTPAAGRIRNLGLPFVPGALALRFVSSDARTFKEPPPDWQIGSWNDPRSYFAGSPEWLAGDLIREGASGVAGQVAEPYLDGVIRPDVLFPAYLSGFNLVESFFLALPYLSWRSVVIGDPLCAPFRSGHEVPAEDLDPALDPETELPAFFSERRLRASAAGGTPGRELKLLAKVEARLARDEAQGARHALEAAVRLDSQMPGAQAMLASLYDQAGEYDRAVAWYEASLTTRPQNAAALNNLAYTLAVNKGELERALELAGKAYILSNGDPLMTDTLAWIQHLSGNHEEAARLLQQAVRGAPDHAEVRFHAAVVDAARGELAGARAELARALQLDPAMALREDARALQRRLEGREE